MRRISIVLVLALAACGGKHPTKEKALAACERSVEIGFLESQAGSGDDSAVKALLEDQKKGPVWKEQVEKCASDAVEHESAAVADCVAAAKTAKDMDACEK